MLFLRIIGRIARTLIGASVFLVGYLFYTSGNVYIGTTALLASSLVAIVAYDIEGRLMICKAINGLTNMSKMEREGS